ncbi:MAG: hypothetical protein HGA65_13000, partial [Oscillochloris sp.]|nr:hypothetical protein [Oscillochloris sp.]
GATFYQLLTGEVPPDALTRATALVVGNPDPLVPAHQRNPQLPSALGDLLQQTMAQAAAQRPASAVALRQALAQAVQPPPTTSSGTQTRQQLSSAGQPTIVMARQDGAPSLVAQSASRSTLQRRLALIGGLALLVLVLATFALLRLLGGDQDSALQVATGGRAPTVVLTATTPVAATPAPGADRSHPLPSSATAQSTSWAVLVTGVTRGDAAWNLLYETNAMADPPPEGQEYLIVHLRARALVGSDARRTLYPELTGDRLVAYRPVAAVTPHERPDEYAVGSEYDIDFPYLVETAESNLIFALDDLGVTGDAPVFIALDEGAKITVDPGLVAIKPTNVGADPREPAQLGEMVTTEDFQVAIHQVVRGDTAYQRLLKANQFNDPPREGYEYLLFLAEVRSISPKDETVMVSGTDFYSVDADADDLEASAITFTSVVEPEPAPPFYLYPGGRATGWVTVEIRKDAPNARIAFGPGMSLNDLNTRYFAIK